ncbi:MAG: VWA domain-containing protein, partial [Terriglobales bacterium]
MPNIGEFIVFRWAKYGSLALVVFLSLGLPHAFAQGADEDVHIIPRKPTTSPAAKAVDDPSLRTYTKPLKVDVDLVLVNVTVTDPMNRLVTGLDKENFRLLEANANQEIRHFSSEDAPISVGVILDLSGSMNNKIQKAKEAIVEFFKTANPQDEFFLVTFSDRPEVLNDFTQSIEEIQGRLVYSIPKGRTALYDAVYLGVSKMRDAKHSKKALLVISDGGDNRSRYTDSEIRSLVREADVQIYAIGIFDDVRSTPEEIRGPFMLTEMTDVTGGRTFPVADINDLSDVAVKIGVELRNQYVLGYRPSNKARDGKWRKLKVKLVAPKG